MLNDTQKKMFEDLIKDKDFRGKDSLKHLLWLNTVNPKFDKGDCFYVTDAGHRIFGYPIIHFKGKIKEIRSYATSETYLYILEVVVRREDGKEITTTCGVYESELIERCEGNLNCVGESKSEHDDAVSVRI